MGDSLQLGRHTSLLNSIALRKLLVSVRISPFSGRPLPGLTGAVPMTALRMYREEKAGAFSIKY